MKILIPFNIGICILIVGALAIAKAFPADIDDDAAFYAFSGKHHPSWLTAERKNVHDYEKLGWSPNYTILRSDFQPIVTKVGPKYYIQFQSEIMKGQP